jgi:type IV pilus assembly protein PilV
LLMFMENPKQRSLLRTQAGVGLVEVLVALLVLSIGLLGLAGLQLRTLRNNQSSLERGIAVMETHAVIDAIRTNLNNIDNFEIDLADDPPAGATFAATVLQNWRDNLTNSLGDGATGSVTCDGRNCTIVIQWNDERGTGGDDEQQITTQVQL